MKQCKLTPSELSQFDPKTAEIVAAELNRMLADVMVQESANEMALYDLKADMLSHPDLYLSPETIKKIRPKH